ncbi:thermonuclease family protein [Pantoea sp. B9002]|uniref:thermonuclease family protein n=1 Tax=Pantoea sp. B9002 TaxID=2726979 RepID=UPI0015A265B1|nr:thermonuclease family protein [Pantoea sp. B9002]NWA64074.1 thermonuclease family protein [Pantoea sp. B9002]
MIKARIAKYSQILFLLCLSKGVYADFTGKVVKVLDGDTVEVLNNGRPERVRLIGIDAPESGQPFGTKAKQHLLNLVGNRQVDVISNSVDRYGRSLGQLVVNVPLPASVTTYPIYVNYEMVSSGLAWAYRFDNKPTDTIAADLESKAKSNKVGLWSAPGAVEPWKWRHTHQKQ